MGCTARSWGGQRTNQQSRATFSPSAQIEARVFPRVLFSFYLFFSFSCGIFGHSYYHYYYLVIYGLSSTFMVWIARQFRYIFLGHPSSALDHDSPALSL